MAPRRLGSAHPRSAPYQAFDASDGQFIVAAGNDALWREVCEATGQQALLDDPRFRDISLRARNQAVLADLLQPVFRTRRVRDWLPEFARRGVPSGPLNTFADILDDPDLAASELVQDMRVPVAGTTKTVAYPVRLNGMRTRAQRPPPRLGEHRDEVFAEWLGASASSRRS